MGLFSKTNRSDVAPFDVTTIEDDIAEALEVARYIKPAQRAATVDDIGTLSAEAVASQFEEAAKAVEQMGADLLDCVRRAEVMAADCKTAIAYVQETADKYREEAKLIRDRIEHVSNLTVEVRSACDEMRRKIEKPKEE